MPYTYYFDWCGFPARVVFDDDGKSGDADNCKNRAAIDQRSGPDQRQLQQERTGVKPGHA